MFYGLLLRVKIEQADVSLQRQFEEPSIFKTMKNKEMKLTLRCIRARFWEIFRLNLVDLMQVKEGKGLVFAPV